MFASAIYRWDVAMRLACMVLAGVGIAFCDGSSSLNHTATSDDQDKSASLQSKSGFLAREEPGLFLIAGSTGGPRSIDGIGKPARFN